MSKQTGYIDSNGHPRLTIRIIGTSSDVPADTEALMDTGFTGFLMLPIAQALPLGLVLVGTADFELADGSMITNFLAKGNVTIRPPTVTTSVPSAAVTSAESETVEGIIVLGGNGAILGMEFLRSLDKLLVVGKIVALVDDSLIARLIV